MLTTWKYVFMLENIVWRIVTELRLECDSAKTRTLRSQNTILMI